MKRIIALVFCLVLALSMVGCGKTIEVSNEKSSIEISSYEEISFEVVFCNSGAVSYSICSTEEDFLFYEGHQFAYVQKCIDGSWYTLVQQPKDSTGDFRGCSIPTEETRGTLSISTLYGSKLEKGVYRLVAPCYTSLEDLWELENPVYIIAEFEID